MSEIPGLQQDPGARGRTLNWLAARPALAVAVAICLMVLAAGAIGLALGSRSAGASFSSTVVPAPPAQVTTDTATVRAAAPAGVAGAPASAAGQAAASLPVVPSSCSAAPTVQFQGRGLVVTGVAPITSSGAAPVTLTVSIQERGADPNTVITGAQGKVQAVVSGLQQSGVPAPAIQQVSFSSFGDAQNRTFTAYATIQAQVATTDQLAQASRAVLQVGGVTGYSTSSALAARPTAEEVQSGVEAAARQARDMAAATARAAGVALGGVQSVAAQPPAICYGPGGPSRVVQVTMTYAIR
jgi:hypothetical protein